MPVAVVPIAAGAELRVGRRESARRTLTDRVSRANGLAPMICLFSVVEILIQAACTCSHGPPQITAGRRFHEERIEQVHARAPASEVIQLLGEPFEVQRLESKEIWRYFVQGVQEESVRLDAVGRAEMSSSPEGLMTEGFTSPAFLHSVITISPYNGVDLTCEVTAIKMTSGR